MMNEFDIKKKLIDENILQIIKFILKPLISSDIKYYKLDLKEKNYLKNYFDLLKIKKNINIINKIGKKNYNKKK